MIVAAEFQYFTVHQLDGNGVVTECHKIGLVALGKRVTMSTEDHLLLGWNGIK
jgi:hypothetical protein